METPGRPSPETLWQKTLEHLRQELPTLTFETWALPIRPVGFDGKVFTLEVKSEYNRQYTQERLSRLIEHCLTGVVGYSTGVNMVVAEPPSATVSIPIVVVEEDPLTTVAAEEAQDSQTPQKGETAASRKKKLTAPPAAGGEESNYRKQALQRAYGNERMRIIQPERVLLLTQYFFHNWWPLLGNSAALTVMAARSLCYWNVRTGETRDTIETDMAELAQKSGISLRSVKDALALELVQRYFIHYKTRRVMTDQGIRNIGILLQVRMDDPLTPEDQETYKLIENDTWFASDFSED